jgi:hypothetical protein
MQRDSGSSEVEVRRATADDARAIGAVFDAAVRAGWTYLGELARSRCSRRRTGTSSWPTTARRRYCWWRPTELGKSSGIRLHTRTTARCSSSSSTPPTRAGHRAHAAGCRPRRAARCRVPAGVPVHPRAERAGAGGLPKRRVSPRRISSRIRLRRHHNPRTATRQTALTRGGADPAAHAQTRSNRRTATLHSEAAPTSDIRIM